MRFVERTVSTSIRALRQLVATCVTVVVATACADGFTPLTSAPAPEAVVVDVLRPGAVRITWQRVTATLGGVSAYVVERRVNLAGPFAEIGRVLANAEQATVWIDTDVKSDSIYGYRIYAVTNDGERSPPSVIGGAAMPPAPGMSVETISSAVTSDALDADGYELVITGPDSVRSAIAPSGTRRFTPLRTGRYRVALSGLAPQCAAETAEQDVEVTDTTARTIAPVQFRVSCSDPNRGAFTVLLRTTGANLDPSIVVDVLGQAADVTLPVAQRTYSAQRTATTGAPRVRFDNLLPGSYNVSLRDVATNCSVQGSGDRTVSVSKLRVDSLEYVVRCTGAAAPTPPPTAPIGSKPFTWRSRWNPKTAPNGASVELEQSLDLTARAGQTVRVTQASLFFNEAVLRYEEEITGQLPMLTVNAATPGRINFIAATTGPARSGVVNLAKFRFTVIGASGTTSPIRTQLVVASGPTPFVDSVSVVEDTLTVGAVNATNQAPIARAGGPYAGVVGSPVVLSAAASSDPDGSIASYAWAFGDNTSGTGVSPSKIYTSAGTFTARVTVTDNRGATATADATVTITAGGTPPVTPPAAPVAEANGPYTAQVGQPLTLSSVGSTGATSFSWALGNGQTATGAAPVVTYAAAGTYMVVLTARNAANATSTDQATVTVTAAPVTPPPGGSVGRPLVWATAFGAYSAVNNLVTVALTLDLTQDLPETSGPEAIETFALDSLKWNPALLQLSSVNLGPGVAGTVNQSATLTGRLSMRGTVAAPNQQGVVTIATLRFRLLGTTGQSATLTSFLGALLGPSSTNFFSYNSKTTIVDGQYTLP